MHRSTTPQPASSPGTARDWLLPVSGMHCAACATRLQKVLQHKPGVQSAAVNLATAQAQVSTSAEVTFEQLQQWVAQTGFQVPQQTLTFTITGISCAACVQRIEKRLRREPGVLAIAVNVASGQTAIQATPDLRLDTLVPPIRKLGFDVQLPSATGDSPAPSAVSAPLWPVVIAALCSLPLVVPMLAMLVGVHLAIPPLWQWLLATPVQCWLGWRFYRGAWLALRSGGANMDVLVALGTSAAYGMSLWQWMLALRSDWVAHQPIVPELYFEASAVVITLVLLGKWLEARARQQTSAAIAALQALRPDQAEVWRDGHWQSLALALLAVGDTVRVAAGARIPVDGEVLRGESLVDESLLTGESLPVLRAPGETVLGGAMNGDGVLEIRVTRLGAETTLARIIRLVEQAQLVKAPVQKLVDRVSGVFVPVVVAIAVLTLLGWGLTTGDWQPAILHGVAVLVIACPCALGLATPATIMVGTGVAARHGILIRDALALEQAQAITDVVFDKTGTLTAGHPVLVDWQSWADIDLPTGSFPAGQALMLAAGLSVGSAHPLSRAVLAAASAQGRAPETSAPDLQAITALPGRGVQGEWAGATLQLGSDRLLQAAGLAVHGAAADWLQQAAEQGHTCSWLIQVMPGAPRLLAGFAFSDELRVDAREAVRGLQQQGIRVQMLTGDNPAAAARVADQLGLDGWQAGLLPEQKAGALQQWQGAGRVVAMVGDGINDAPALAAADVGVAMGSGSDVAMQAAQITLMRPAPALVLAAIRLSRATWHKIRQNLFWAFFYNVIGIPLAAAGWLNPMVAGAAMALSSFCVVSNALLLRRWRMPTANRRHDG